MLVPFCLFELVGSGQVPYSGIPTNHQFSAPSCTGFLEECILRKNGPASARFQRYEM